MKRVAGYILLVIAFVINIPLQIGISVYGLIYVIRAFIDGSILTGIIAIPIAAICVGIAHLLAGLILAPLNILILVLLGKTDVESQEREMSLAARAEIAEEHKDRSNKFGTWSLVLGIISLIFWPEVTGTAAVVLGVLQFRRHATKRAIAGFTLGVVGIVLVVAFDLLGLYSLFP